MIIVGNKITAADGKMLTNGEAYCKAVWLGREDHVSNWTEIPEKDVPTPSESQSLATQIVSSAASNEELREVIELLLTGVTK